MDEQHVGREEDDLHDVRLNQDRTDMIDLDDLLSQDSETDDNLNFKAESRRPVDSLAHAHQQLCELSDELQAKAAQIAVLEKSIVARERQLQIEKSTFEEEMKATIDSQKRARNRLAQDERMLREDTQLMEERIRLRNKDYLKEQEAQMKSKTESLLQKLDQTQAQLAATKNENKNLLNKNDLLTKKNRALEAQLNKAKANASTLTGQTEQLASDLANANKKLKVQTWKFEKHLAKTQNEIKEALSASRISSGSSSQAFGNNLFKKQAGGGYLLLLVDGLVELAIGTPKRKGMGVDQVPSDLFAQSILPGICHAIELNAAIGTTETAKQLLVLTLHCIGHLEETNQENGLHMDGLIDRFATRLLGKLILGGKKSVKVLAPNTSRLNARDLEDDEDRSISQDSQLRQLFAMTKLCLMMLKKSHDPNATIQPIRTLLEFSATSDTQALLLRFPNVIDPVVHILGFAALPAWKNCVDEAVLLLLALGRKGPHLQSFVALVAQSKSFRYVCLSVFNAIKAINSHSRNGNDTICEAASVISMFLQRLSETGSGRTCLKAIFKQTDLVGILQSCIQATSSLQTGSSQNIETIDFFIINTEAIIAALK